MWTFEQSTGKVLFNGLLAGKGYAGGNIPPNHNAAAVNNPAAQSEPKIGPLPQGFYTIGIERTDPKLGPVAMPLDPDSTNEMYSRSGFFIHADSIKHPGQASEGCIVLNTELREQIANSGDNRLQVVEG